MLTSAAYAGRQTTQGYIPKTLEHCERVHNNAPARHPRCRHPRCPSPPPSPFATMDPGARRRACAAFRVKLSRDTGTNLAAAAGEDLLGATFERQGEEVTLQSNPGLFYTILGDVIEDPTLPLDLPDHLKVAWYCFREAAEVHKHPVGMFNLYRCLYDGQGVAEDPAQAVVWLQKAADLGDPASQASLGACLLDGDPCAGVVKDAARGFALLREAVDEGYGMALHLVAKCYLKGEGVEKDVVHGVSLLRQVINQEDASRADAEVALASCYMQGNGVEVDTVQAALWCRKAVTSGDARATELLPIIRRCDFCGTTPARQLCVRFLKVRYCDHQCQLADWNHATDPHKGPCKEHRRRAVEASEKEAGDASPPAR